MTSWSNDQAQWEFAYHGTRIEGLAATIRKVVLSQAQVASGTSLGCFVFLRHVVGRHSLMLFGFHCSWMASFGEFYGSSEWTSLTPTSVGETALTTGAFKTGVYDWWQ